MKTTRVGPTRPIRRAAFRALQASFQQVRAENLRLAAENTDLRRQVDQYQTWFNKAPIGFHIIDRDGIIREVNIKWLELLGYTEADLPNIIGKKTIFEFIVDTPEQRGDALTRFQVRLGGKDPGESTLIREYQRKDGSTLYVATYNSEIRDSRGEIVAFQTSFQDITSRIRAEKLLKEAERRAAVGEFIGFVSHNYKNSLVVLASICQSLKELDGQIRADLASVESYQSLGSPVPLELSSSLLERQAQRESLVRRLEEEIHNMDSSVKRMLEYSRSGTEEKTTIALKENLNHLLLLMNEVAKRNNITLTWDLSALNDRHGIHVSLSGFQDSFRNLVTNAIEAFAPKDPGLLPREIVVSAALIDPGTVKISIQDTGIGMSPDRVKQLYATVVVSSKKSGHGLGIREVLKFVSSSGASISISSQLGSGTTIETTFPLSEFIKSDPPPVGRITELTRERASQLNVLLIDDNDSSITLYQTLLEMLGFNVTSAETAESALEQARIHPDKFDIVITDEGLPTTYGHDLIDQLRPILAKPRVCYIINSGYERPEESDHPVNRILAEVGGKYMQKPARSGEFRQLVTRFVLEWLNTE